MTETFPATPVEAPEESLAGFSSTPAMPVPEGKSLLFSLNGVDYYIENRSRPSYSYGFLLRLRTEGEQAASAYLMEKLLGFDAMTALSEYEDLTDEENEQIQAIITRIGMGGSKK